MNLNNNNNVVTLNDLGSPFSWMTQDGTINWSVDRVKDYQRLGGIILSRKGSSLKVIASITNLNFTPALDLFIEWSISDNKAIQVKSLLNKKPHDFDDVLKTLKQELLNASQPVFSSQEINPSKKKKWWHLHG